MIDKESRGAKPITAVLVLVPDGTATVVGVSTDEAALNEHLAAFVANQETETLAGIQGLARLKDGKVLTGGFATILGFLDELFDPLDRRAGGLDKAREAGRLASSMPHGGKTPIVWTVDASADGPTLTAKVQVPKRVVEDIAAGFAAKSAERLRF
jgi:hypothetical protein